MWHLTACKISVSLSFLNWIKNEMIFFFYRVSELMLQTLIQRHDKKKSFHFKNERLTEILQAVRCHIFFNCINNIYHFIKPFLDNEMFEEYWAFNSSPATHGVTKRGDIIAVIFLPCLLWELTIKYFPRATIVTFYMLPQKLHKQTFQTSLVHRATLAQQVSEKKSICCPAPFQVTVHHNCLQAASQWMTSGLFNGGVTI